MTEGRCCGAGQVPMVRPGLVPGVGAGGALLLAWLGGAACCPSSVLSSGCREMALRSLVVELFLRSCFDKEPLLGLLWRPWPCRCHRHVPGECEEEQLRLQALLPLSISVSFLPVSVQFASHLNECAQVLGGLGACSSYRSSLQGPELAEGSESPL